MKQQLAQWLDEVIQGQQQLIELYKKCPVDEVKICTSCLDVCVQFYQGLEKLAEELGYETSRTEDYYGIGKDKITVAYPKMELLQVTYSEED